MDENTEAKLGALNTTPFLNRSACKKFLLDYAQQTRGFEPTRCGLSILERLNAKLVAMMREEVRIHPSKGKTLL